MRPKLAQIAFNVLPIPPTSACAERLFSEGAMLMTKRRSRLSDATIELMLCLRSWKVLAKSDLSMYFTGTSSTDSVRLASLDRVQSMAQETPHATPSTQASAYETQTSAQNSQLSVPNTQQSAQNTLRSTPQI
jgi:hypothetical protein